MRRPIGFLVALVGLFAFGLARADWGPDVQLTFGTPYAYTDSRCLDGAGDSVFVVWYDNRDGNWEIYFKRSKDAGSSWGSDIRLTFDDSLSWFPALAVDGWHRIHVVWEDFRDGRLGIYYKRSTDGGDTFSLDLKISPNMGSMYMGSPAVAACGDTVYVAWYNENQEIPYLINSTDGGITWSDTFRLSGDSVRGDAPSIFALGPDVFASWKYYNRLYFRHRQGAWGPVQNITMQAHAWLSPILAASSGGIVHLVWEDDRQRASYPQIYYKRSTDYGATWSPDTQLSYGSVFCYHPSIWAKGQYLHLIWTGHDTLPYPNEFLYYRRSTDNGTTWESDTQLTSPVCSAVNPSIYALNNDVHVVWQDTRPPGGVHLYYKKGTGLSGINFQGDPLRRAYTPFHFHAVPNPTKGPVRFSITGGPILIRGAPLIVFDVAGHFVRNLGEFPMRDSPIEMTWDGKDENGQRVSSGIYLVALKTSAQFEGSKQLLLGKVIVIR